MDFFTIPKEDIIKQIERHETFKKGNEEVLLWASINGYNDIVKSLIKANKEEPGKFPLKVNKYWNLALRYAAEHGHVDTIQLLLDAGADEPTYDDIITNDEKKKINYTAVSAPGSKQYKERYNYLLLDWIYDSSSPLIFEMLKKHIESKNISFHYFGRPVNLETGSYKSRWHVIKFQIKREEEPTNKSSKQKSFSVTFMKSYINKTEYKVTASCTCDYDNKYCKHITDILIGNIDNVVVGKSDNIEEVEDTTNNEDSGNSKDKIIDKLNIVFSWMPDTTLETKLEVLRQGRIFEDEKIN